MLWHLVLGQVFYHIYRVKVVVYFNVRLLLRILGEYERASGQKINLLKSKIYCSRNVAPQDKEELAEMLGVQIDDGKGLYLGMPYMIGRSKREILSFVKEKVKKKLKGWKEKTLTQAGREVLIKSVAQAIPAYLMSCFKLTKRICDDIKSMVRDFWWGQNNNERRICWMSWEKLCKKKSEGGMGFKDLEDFNMALLAKQGWRLMKDPNSLAARFLQSKYFPQLTLMEAKPSTSPSYLWRSILEARNLLAKGVRWRIGNGESVKVWDDPWIPIPYSFKVAQLKKESCPGLTVSELIHFDTGQWNENPLSYLFLNYEAELIRKIPLSPWWPQDELIWHYTKDGLFTVRSTYHLFMDQKSLNHSPEPSSSAQGREQGLWKKIWRLEIPLRIQHFLWRACSGILATAHNIHRRTKKATVECGRCGEALETDKHLLFECQEAKQVWNEVSNFQMNTLAKNGSFKDWFFSLLETGNQEDVEYLAVIMWLIWKSRNERIFEGNEWGAKKILNYGQCFHQEYKTSHAKRVASTCYQQLSRNDSNWKPPPEDYLKLNVDGSFTERGAGMGLVVRNHKGELEAMMTENLPNCFDADHAETLGFLKAFEFARDFGISHFELEGDAQHVINKLLSMHEDLSMTGHIIEGVRKMIKEFPQVKLSYVIRKYNVPAHEAAQLAIHTSGRNVWFTSFPKTVMNAVKFDASQ